MIYEYSVYISIPKQKRFELYDHKYIDLPKEVPNKTTYTYIPNKKKCEYIIIKVLEDTNYPDEIVKPKKKIKNERNRAKRKG